MWAIYIGLFILGCGAATGIWFEHCYPHAHYYLLLACIFGGMMAAGLALALLDRLQLWKHRVGARR